MRNERLHASILSLPSSHRRRHERAAESVASNVLLADALQRMARDKISSLLVAPLGSSMQLRATTRRSSPSAMYCVLLTSRRTRTFATGRPFASKPLSTCRPLLRVSGARPDEPPETTPPRSGGRERRDLRHHYLTRPAAASRARGVILGVTQSIWLTMCRAWARPGPGCRRRPQPCSRKA